MSTYSMNALCPDCRKPSLVLIPKGTSPSEWKKQAECEHCGVKGNLNLTPAN